MAVAGTRVIILRDEGGRVRAFFNVCRHRGHELIGCGDSRQADVVRCPYHGWVYGLDGVLRSARHCDQQDFARENHGLLAVAAEEWHGWLFVNTSGSAVDLPSYAGSRLTAGLAPWEPSSLVEAARDEYVVQANWKLIAENYHECYHCALVHPELCQVSPPDSGYQWSSDGAWVGGSMEFSPGVETMSLNGSSGARPLPGLSEAQRRMVLYLELFPNLLISLHPDYILTHTLEPLAIDRTRVECRYLFAADVVAEGDFEPSYATEFWDLTNKQDWAVCEGVQRGISSGAYRQGPLSNDEESLYHHLAMVGYGYHRGEFYPRWADEMDLPSRYSPPSAVSF